MTIKVSSSAGVVVHHYQDTRTPLPLLLQHDDGTWHTPTSDQYDLLMYALRSDSLDNVHAVADSNGKKWNAFVEKDKDGGLTLYSHTKKKSTVYKLEKRIRNIS